MKTKIFVPAFLILLTTAAWKCSSPAENNSIPANAEVVIETDFGKIKLMLYNETPIHRDNFLKLAEEGFYEDLLFHRLIQGFMIQGGDPESKAAPAGARLGSGDPGYTLPAEIHPHLFHKKGALAAARMGDNVNPEKRSSGSQFYIVQGTVLNDTQLAENEKRVNSMRLQSLFYKLFEEEKNAAFEKDEPVNLEELAKIAQTKAEKINAAAEGFTFSEEHRMAYKSIGGAPHLDGSYTVFGEVIEGLNVIDKIAALPVDQANRPLQDVRMKIKILKK